MPSHCEHGDLITNDELVLRWRQRDHGICRTSPQKRCTGCGHMLIKTETAEQVLRGLKIPGFTSRP